MKPKTILKSIEIKAKKEKIWDVLILDKYNRKWYAAFMEGTYAETDWKKGSKALFLDKERNGMIAIVEENKPYELLSLEYQGEVLKGKENYESESAKAIKGGREIYKLSEINGVTTLHISGDMTEELFDYMSASWDKALQKIKELAEKM